MITLDAAVTGYGKVRVLREVSLTLAAGEVVAVVGSNGAGKTTLAKTVAGLNPLWSGSLTWEGKDISRWSADRRAAEGIVLCPEGRRILAGLTVEENLKLGATPLSARLGRREAQEAAREEMRRVYDRFPVLEERRGQGGGTLSGGQQQMLAIGRALMARPRALILDEPSLGLAPRIVAEVYAALRSLREQGLGMILIEEGASRALAFADRGIVMQNGRIVTEGSADALASDPALFSSYLGIEQA